MLLSCRQSSTLLGQGLSVHSIEHITAHVQVVDVRQVTSQGFVRGSVTIRGILVQPPAAVRRYATGTTATGGGTSGSADSSPGVTGSTTTSSTGGTAGGTDGSTSGSTQVTDLLVDFQNEFLIARVLKSDALDENEGWQAAGISTTPGTITGGSSTTITAGCGRVLCCTPDIICLLEPSGASVPTEGLRCVCVFTRCWSWRGCAACLAKPRRCLQTCCNY